MVKSNQFLNNFSYDQKKTITSRANLSPKGFSIHQEIWINNVPCCQGLLMCLKIRLKDYDLKNTYFLVFPSLCFSLIFTFLHIKAIK